MQTQDVVDLKTIDGKQYLHSVSFTGCPGEVKVRVLACHCYSCTHDDDDDDECLNIDICGPWQFVDLHAKQLLHLPNLPERRKIFTAVKKLKRKRNADHEVTYKTLSPLSACKEGCEYFRKTCFIIVVFL